MEHLKSPCPSNHEISHKVGSIHPVDGEEEP